ncbi:50S ribosomal subunit protein L13 [Alphaproteobacteria bacterium]
MSSYTTGTFVATPSYIKREWWLVDAAGETLGRLASRIALVLRGKHKPYYTPNINCGDHVVVVNAEKIKVTGKKLVQEKFYWHTGWPGGIKERTWEKILKSKYPERLIKKAVQRMLPKESPLARRQFESLHVYAGVRNPHTAQTPKMLNFNTTEKFKTS